MSKTLGRQLDEYLVALVKTAGEGALRRALLTNRDAVGNLVTSKNGCYDSPCQDVLPWGGSEQQPFGGGQSTPCDPPATSS
jgi:hypothetical protein